MSATLTSSPVATTDTVTNSATPAAPARSRSAVRSIWKTTGVSGIAAASPSRPRRCRPGRGRWARGRRRADPLLGFAQLTLAGAVIGGVLATILHTRAHRPPRPFVVTAVALTAVSIVPDFTMPIEAASSVVSPLTHVVAAAIIVPSLAARTVR